MAKYSNTVEYNIKTNLDASGIAKLNTQLRQVEAELQRLQGRGVLSDTQVKKDLANINQIKTALNAAFNPNLGMLDTKKFMAGLTAGGKTLQSYANTFNTLGTKGTQAFASWYGQLGKIDTGMRQISKTGDKIMNTLGNTVRWGLIASAFSSVMNAAHQSVQYVQDLDRSLTNIMMVSGETKANMNDFARSANEIAQRLGGTTTQMTEATKVFVQQGMSLGQSSQMAEYAVHLANISEQDSSTTSDELTAMKNAFKLEIGDMGNAVSKWAAIANNAAVSMEELSVASQKAASVANTVGVSMEQFAGHIAAIEATTREAPENIGNGLKTLYSRIADIKLGDTLEDGVNYGQFSGALKKVGVDVLDVTGEMKDAGTIMEEIMAVWQDLSRTQQNALATTVAGRFQLARFEALMNSQDIYKKSVSVAREETGTETYDRMQDTYRESLEGRSKALTAAIEEIFLKAFDTDSFYAVIDVTTQLVKVFGDLVEAVGGGGAALTAFGAILTKVMSNNISRGMANFAANRQRDAMVQSNVATARLNAQEQLSGKGISLKDAQAQQVVNDTAKGAQYAHLMNQQQFDIFNKSLEQRTQLLAALKAAEEQEAKAVEQMATAFATVGTSAEAAEAGTIAFLEMLNEAGASITIADLEANGLKTTIQNLGTAQSELTNLAAATELVAETETKAAKAAVELAEAEAQAGRGSQQYAEAEERAVLVSKQQVEALEMQQQAAVKVAESFAKLSKDTNLSTQAQEKFENIVRLAQEAMSGDWHSIEQFSQSLREAQIDTNLLVEAVTQLSQKGLMTEETFIALIGQSERLREAFESAGISAQIFNKQMANQNNMNTIVNAVSAVGQLAFAWQSVKNLGSLFVDEDIDSGKKLEEIIMNLGMTVPMVMMGVTQLSTALGGKGFKNGLTQLKTINSVNKQVATGAITAAEGEAILAASTQATGIAATTAGAAFKAMIVSMGPLLGITAIIMGLTAAWGAYSEHVQQAKDAELDRLNETTAATQELQGSLDTWEELYKDFQETGTASEQAKEKAKELADELEIAGGKALAASGNFEALNTSIQKLGDTKLKENITAAKDLLEGEYGKSLKGEELFNGSAQSDYATALSRGIGTQADEYGNVIYESSVANLLKQHQLGPNASVAETIGEARSAVADLEQYLEDLEKQESSMNPQVFKQYKEEAQNAKQALREFLSLDDIKAAEQAYKSLFENGTQLSDFQSKLKAAGTSLKEMRDVFATDSNTREYFNNMATEAERLQMMLAATKDEAQQLKIEVAQTGSEAATNMMQMQIENGASQESARETTQGIFDRISNMGLYDEQAIELMAMISEEDSIDAINEGLKRIEESGNIEDFKIPVEPPTDEELRDQTWESTKNYSKDNMEESVDLETATAFGEYLAQNAESLEGYDGALEKNADLLKEVVEEQGRYDAALQETQKSYDDWSDALENGSLVEQAKAGAELSEVYEDLLDIGEDLSLSDKFTQDTENLESLKQAAEGVEGAYDDLQDAAAEDIMMQADLDDSQVQEKMAILNSLQDSIADIDIGATIDDEAAYQQMEDLINGLGLDAQTASEYLKMVAGIEIDPSAFEEVLPGVVDAAAEAGNQTADSLTFDTEIQSGTAQESSTDTYYDVKAQLTSVPFEATLPAGKEGGTTTLTGSVPEVTYTATPVPINKESSTAGFAVNTKSKGGGGGGGAGLKIKRGSASKGSSGGAKYAASPYGGGTKHPSGGGGGCFIAGTPITLHGYYKNIEDIQIGDIVLSYNEKLMRNEYSEVLETMIHLVNEKIYHLYIENEELVVTGIHRFLIIHYGKKEWVPASELQTGDLVLFANGTWHRIYNIQTEIKNTLVYNFEVSNNHNYYVGHNQILAHNKGGGGKKGKGGGGNKKKDTNLAKSAEVENDIYQEINSTLKSLNQQYSKLEKTTSRIYGPERRKNIEQQLKLLEKERLATKDRVKIAQAYLKALETGKSNSKYGISMKNKPSLKSTGLKDYDGDGSIDNYIEKFEQARKAAQAADDAANKYYEDHGGKINKKTGVATKEAQMTEKQQKEYEKLTKAAEKRWKIAENINTVSKEYEETMAKIKDDEEAMIEYQQQMEDLMIDLYHDALDAADAIKDIKDTSAELKGFFSGFSSDSPFRALIEDAQRFQDIMSATDKEFDNYIDNAVKVLEKELEAVKSQGDKDKIAAYKNSIKWYKDKKTEYDINDIGKGELGMATLQLEEMSRWMEQVKNGKLDGLPADSPYRTNTKQLFEDYENQYNKVAKLTLEAERRLESLQKDQIEALEDTAKRYEKLMDKYDKVAKDLDRTSKRVGIWQGEDAYGAQADISKQLAQTKKQAAQSAKTVLDQYQKARDAAIEKEDAERPARIEKQETEISRIENKLSEAKSEKDKLELEQQLANAKVRLEEIKNDYSEETQWYIDKYEEVYEEIQDLQDEAAEAMKDAYLNAINEIDAQMTETLFGDRNLENITNNWEWDKDYYGKYKDDVEKTYEIEKLRLKYLDLLDDSQNRSLATQRRIRQAMEEQLDLLEHQGTMSEYDVKLANARLEILQKQLALEDARQNKNQMKLRRDTQGNYKYVYSADEGDIRAKQSDLMDEEFNAYEMSKEANRDAMDNVVALWNRYIEQKQALSEKYYNDEDKLRAELEKLEKNFIDAMEANKEDLDDSYNGMILSLEWMVTTGTEDIANMAQDVMDNLDVTNQEAMERLGYAWSTTIYDVGTQLDELETQVQKDIDETIEAQKELCDFITGDEGIGAVTKDQYGQAEQAIKKATDATQELQKETDLLNNTLNQELKATSAAEKKIQEYEAQLKNAKEATSALRAKIDSAEQSLIEQKQKTEDYKTKYENALTEAANEKRMRKGDFQKGDTFTLKKGTVVYYGRGGGQSDAKGRKSYTLEKDTQVKIQSTHQKVLDKNGKPTNQDAEHHVGFFATDRKQVMPDREDNPTTRENEQWHLSPAELVNAMKLDTGGYTGDWNNKAEGRLAVLHEKELVLNRTDTENILTAIQLVRETISQLKASSITDIFKNISNTSAYAGNNIEQKISITAEFPSASSADEIKQALLNLADSAMQYAYKER